MNIVKYKLKLQFLIIIEYLYKTLCSYFPYEILKKMKWYVGESFIYDYNSESYRQKEFYINYGFYWIEIIKHYVSYQHQVVYQDHLIDKVDK